MSDSAREAVAAVGAAAARVLKGLSYLRFFIAHVAQDSGGDDDISAVGVNNAASALRAEAEALNALFAPLSDWWVDRPPGFAPQAASAVEGLLRVAARECALVDRTDVNDQSARCRWVLYHVTPIAFGVDVGDQSARSRWVVYHNVPAPFRSDTFRFALVAADVEEFYAALRCELATLLLKPGPRPGDTAFWSQIFPEKHVPDWAELYESAQRFVPHPPRWGTMSEAERVAAIDAAVPRPPASESARPSWSSENRVLLFRGSTVRDYRKRSGRNLFKLLGALERAGWPTAPVPVAGLTPKAIDDAVGGFNRSAEPDTIRLSRTVEGVTWSPSPGRSR